MSSATATSHDSAGDRPDASATVEPAAAASSVEPGPQTSQPVVSEPVPQPVTAQPLAPQPLAPQQATASTATATATATASSSAPPMAGGLEGVIAQLYQSKGGSPTADDFITALQAHFGDQAEAQINHPQFAWELMRLVGENSGKRLHEQIRVSGCQWGSGPSVGAISTRIPATWRAGSPSSGRWTDGRGRRAAAPACGRDGRARRRS